MDLFLALGPAPLANAFLRSPDEFAAERTYPLDVCFCRDCHLVQTPDVIDPEELFRDYVYVTGTSTTMAAHNRDYARTVVELLSLTEADRVIEIASNDGSLLRCFQTHGVKALGIEPARNIAAQARAAGVETLDIFFCAQAARDVRQSHGTARAVVANNVLAHVDDPVDFLRGGSSLLAEDGLFVAEVPYLGSLLERLEYDTIYHEHLCYFSITSLLRACEAVGLSVIRVDHMPVHGGSLRIYAGLTATHGGHNAQVLAEADQERELGLDRLDTYQKFADDVAAHRTKLTDRLHALRNSGATIAAYGAPAKGNTLLNYCGIDTALIDFTVDKNEQKVGRFTPGAHIPVLPVETIVERQPDYVMILAWNFAEEIMSQQQTYRDHGGKFLIPIPEPTIV